MTWWIVVAVVIGCGSDPDPDAATDAGTDAGTATDAATATDAGTDAATAMDAGRATDAATHPDAFFCGAPPHDGAIGEIDECGACGMRGGPPGGGVDYESPVARTDAFVTVHSAAALLVALTAASCGDVIWIDDAAEIDLTGFTEIDIPAGVTLASGRGVLGSLGARLFTTQISEQALFHAGEGSRVSGLRFHGPGPGTTGDPSGGALFVRRLTSFELDNCELTGWRHYGVQVSASFAWIHHNHIHHNLRGEGGLGYGVLLNGSADALIEANHFDANRHSISGNGHDLQRYEARFNLVGANAGLGDDDDGHAFDMHPDGDRIHVHHNTFLLTAEPAVQMQGTPRTGCFVDHNSVVHSAPDSAPTRPFVGCEIPPTDDNCYAGVTRCP